MTRQTNIKRLDDGSIDCALYIAHSRSVRSKNAHRITTVIGQMIKGCWLAMKQGSMLLEQPKP